MSMQEFLQVLKREWATTGTYDHEYLEALESRLANHRGGSIAAIVCGITCAELGMFVLPLPVVLVLIVLSDVGAISGSIALAALLPSIIGGVLALGVAGLVVGYAAKWSKVMHFVRCATDEISIMYEISVRGVLISMGILSVVFLVSRIAFWGIVSVALLGVVAYCRDLGTRLKEPKPIAFFNVHRYLAGRIVRRPRIGKVFEGLFELSDEATRQQMTGKRSVGVELISEAVDRLRDESDWLERFLVRHDAILIGGTRLLHLRASTKAEGKHFPDEIRRAICHETSRCRRGKHICLDCFCLVERYESYYESYWACRRCGGSHRMSRVKGRIIAVLQESCSRKRLGRTQPWQVNWSAVGHLFDFDHVEIHEATDAHVERLVLQVRNDADDPQRQRIKRAKCCVHGVTLNQNSIRLLKQVFRRVKLKLRHQYTIQAGSELVLSGQPRS